MATLDEILSFSENEESYLVENPQFLIDEDLRTIAFDSRGSVIGVVGDKNVNRINFQMNRMYNGFDMSEFQIRVNYVNAAGQPNYYNVTDMEIDGDIIRFSWLVDSDATAYIGDVTFVCVLFKLQGAVITQAFNTTLAKAKVLEGLAVDGYVDPDTQTDIVMRLVEDIKSKIPDDYTELTNKVDDFMENVVTEYAERRPITKLAFRDSGLYREIAEMSDVSKVSDSVGTLATIPNHLVNDWSFIGTSTYPAGWQHGYANATVIGSATTSSYLRTVSKVPVNGMIRATIYPPSGCAIAVVTYPTMSMDDTDGTLWGSANLDTIGVADKPIEVDFAGSVGFIITVGKFTASEASTKLQDRDFIKSIHMVYDVANEDIAALNTMLNVKHYTALSLGREYGTDDVPNGWVSGYSNASKIETDNVHYIRNVDKIPCTGISMLSVTPPTGGAVGIVCYRKLADTFGDMFGSANVTSVGVRDKTITVELTGYDGFIITIGYFLTKEGYQSYDYVDDELFLDNARIAIATVPASNSGGSGSGGIQPYFEDEMETTVSTVRNLLTEPCFVAPIVTDIHYPTVNTMNFDHTIENITEFAKRVKCDAVLNCGDNTNGWYEDTDELIGLSDYMTEKFMSIGVPYFMSLGNHDRNYYSSSGHVGTRITSEQAYRAYLTVTKDVVVRQDSNGSDYYKDYPQYGMRLVCINANGGPEYSYEEATAVWLKYTALDTNSTVVLFEHLSPINTQNWNGKKVTNYLPVFNALSDFAKTHTLIHIAGHTHVDFAFDPKDVNAEDWRDDDWKRRTDISTAPWLAIVNVCTKAARTPIDGEEFLAIKGIETRYGASSPEREVGTATEDAWTVLVLRPESRKINLIRFGAGEDREFEF